MSVRSPRNSSSLQSKSSSGNAKKAKPQVTINPAQFKARIQNEKEYIQQHLIEKSLYTVISAENDNRRWTLMFYPNKPPYNVGGFKILIELPPEYPYKPPTIQFITKTYHPNIDENGKMELALCLADCWKPCTRIVQICDSIYQLLNYPDLTKPIRKNIADEMIQNKQKYLQEATEFCKKFCEQI